MPVARLKCVSNVFFAAEGRAAAVGETHIRPIVGPILGAPYNGKPPGTPATVGIRAEDIVLARGAAEDLRARRSRSALFDGLSLEQSGSCYGW